MKQKRKMGRPPASWMFNFVDLKLDKKWTDIYEVSEQLKVGPRVVKAFFEKLSVHSEYEVRKGRARSIFRVSELKKAARDYVKPWQ